MKKAFELIDKLEKHKELAKNEWIFLFDNYDDEIAEYLFRHGQTARYINRAV